jgi:hypothetical protein
LVHGFRPSIDRDTGVNESTGWPHRETTQSNLIHSSGFRRKPAISRLDSLFTAHSTSSYSVDRDMFRLSNLEQNEVASFRVDIHHIWTDDTRWLMIQQAAKTVYTRTAQFWDLTYTVILGRSFLHSTYALSVGLKYFQLFVRHYSALYPRYADVSSPVEPDSRVLTIAPFSNSDPCDSTNQHSDRLSSDCVDL